MVVAEGKDGLALSNIKLVACDIDGTLLQGDERSLNLNAVAMICRLWEHGIWFCTASGRQYACQRRLFAAAGIEDWMYYICENGAAVFQGDIEVSKTPLDRAEAIQMAKWIYEIPQCEALASGSRSCYIVPKGEDYLPLIRDYVGNDTVVVSSWEEIPEEIVKVTAYCRDGGEGHLSEMASAWGERYHVALSGKEWIDITQADKASGLREVCKVLGISPAEVMALGDNYNDISILKESGYPAAMLHSPDEVKKIAAKLFRRAEDGISWLLDNLEALEPQEAW